MAQARQQHESQPDPVVVDSSHYTIEAENERVRILRARYGPKAKSTMHYHPPGFAVALSDAHGRFTYPDGRTEDVDMTAGSVYPVVEGQHLPENLGNEPFEVLIIEVKGA